MSETSKNHQLMSDSVCAGKGQRKLSELGQKFLKSLQAIRYFVLFSFLEAKYPIYWTNNWPKKCYEWERRSCLVFKSFFFYRVSQKNEDSSINLIYDSILILEILVTFKLCYHIFSFVSSKAWIHISIFRPQNVLSEIAEWHAFHST